VFPPSESIGGDAQAHPASNMSPQNRSGEISLYQRLPYVIQLQTVWRLYGDGMETHRFSVPADGDQHDLITLEG
jgi:hypothetical protein